MKVLAKKLWRDLNDLKGQVFTLAILVVCGVAVLVSSWSSYQSLELSQKDYYQRFNFADIFIDFQRAPKEVLEQVQKIPGVEQAEGRIIDDALLEIPGQLEPGLGRFISWNKNQQLNQIYLIEGRWPEHGAEVEVLVHQSFAKAHNYHVGDRLSASFKGKKTTVQISGIGLSPEYIYALSPVSIFPDDQHFGIFWVLSEELEQLAQMQGSINNIVTSISADSSIGAIKMSLDLLLDQYGTLGAYDRSKQMSNLFIQDEIREQKSMAAVIPTIFVLVGAFILNIVMSRLISLHRSQICILKAMGYSSFQLSLYYLKLITFILVLGIVPGLLLAEGIGRYYTFLYGRYFHFPHMEFKITMESFLMGFGSGLLPGWIASLRSLLQVYKMAPAEGMRPPSPPNYRMNLAEKRGLIKLNNIFNRMIYRDLFFRPWRLTAAVIGISGAVAIIVTGNFWVDIVNFMIKRQFYEMNREDLEVQLLYPRSYDILNEVRMLPGVIYVEGARSVPVRMRFKSEAHETRILSFNKQSQLRTIIGESGKSIPLPENGVLLSSIFKNKYELQLGQSLEFEILRGQKHVFTLPISGFVDDLMGSSAYIGVDLMNKLIKEESSFDVLFMKVDSSKIDSLYAKLKSSLHVGSVTVKTLLLNSFKKTVAEMISVFTSILMVFSVAISGAIIFNISRITFSEKNWELASLRILGFGIGTVFNLLFVYIGVQVLMALLPGVFLGYFLSFASIHFLHTDTLVFPLVIEPKTYGVSIVAVILTYLISGLFVYGKVKKINMSEALKARD